MLVTNPDRQNATLAAAYTYNNPAPQIAISATPLTGTAPLTVNFTGSATDGAARIPSYRWDFGDGDFSNQAAASEVYRRSGSFTAVLTVTDNLGAISSKNVTIVVTAPADHPPRVSISASPATGPSPLAVTFTSAASDPDGQVTGYLWDFGDGQTSTAGSPSHTYTGQGNFAARLTATDNSGATASPSISINVLPAEPDFAITHASFDGKNLIVHGRGLIRGCAILVDGSELRTK